MTGLLVRRGPYLEPLGQALCESFSRSGWPLLDGLLPYGAIAVSALGYLYVPLLVISELLPPIKNLLRSILDLDL